MKTFLLLTILMPLIAASAVDYEQHFNDFIETHQTNYPNQQERDARFEIFKSNLDRINDHNSRGFSWTLGVNQFADKTNEEFRQMNSLRFPWLRLSRSVHFSNDTTPPTSVNWTARGAVTPVKNQKTCGSCWAFSTTGSLEGSNFLTNGKLVSLSEQELVDCSTSEGNHGCQGGLMDQGFEFVEKQGLCTEQSYPYTATNEPTCKKCTPVVKATGFTDVQHNNETALLHAVAQQPVSVAVDASSFSWQFYRNGVYAEQCGTSLDHGVLVTGYGELNGKSYWLVKNSWGEVWGDRGYIMLARNVSAPEGQCGVAMQASYPQVAKTKRSTTRWQRNSRAVVETQ